MGSFREQSNESEANLCIWLCMMYVKCPAAKIWPQKCCMPGLIVVLLYPPVEHNEIYVEIKVQPNTEELKQIGLARAEKRRRKWWRIKRERQAGARSRTDAPTFAGNYIWCQYGGARMAAEWKPCLNTTREKADVDAISGTEAHLCLAKFSRKV